MINERRRMRRIQFPRPVRVAGARGERWSARGVDFCLDGIGLEAAREAAVGEEVSVIFNLARPGGRARTVQARGRVAHCERHGAAYVLGVQFRH